VVPERICRTNEIRQLPARSAWRVPHEAAITGQEGLDAHTGSPSRFTAGVDEGLADLVTALNTMPGVMTPGSCQPGPDRAQVTSCTHDRARSRYQYGGAATTRFYSPT
jgi:hypothetical protein